MTPTLRSTAIKGKHQLIRNKDKTKSGTPVRKQETTTHSPATQKRMLSPEQQLINSKNSKKNKTSELSTVEMDDLKQFISQSIATIENKIDASQNSLESKFGELANKVKDDVCALKTTVTDFHAKINIELNAVKTQLSHYAERLDNNDDDFERTQRNQDLRLTGFAYTKDENLQNIFQQVAAEIGYEIGPHAVLPSIERISLYDKSAKKSTPTKTILLHFAILKQKQQFYALYLSKMPLNPLKFGLQNTNHITIGENLTKKNAQIFKQALTMKKSNKIVKAYTENGIVKIKFDKGKNTTAHTVRSIPSLEKIVTEHQNTLEATSNANNGDELAIDITTNGSTASTARDTVAPTDNNNDKGNATSTPMDTHSNTVG